MSGSHRNHEVRPGLASKAPVIAIVVGVLALAIFLVWTVVDDENPQAPTFESSPTTSQVPDPVPVTDPTANSPIDDLPRIAASSPKRLVIAAAVDAGFDNAVTPENGVLEASSAGELSRVKDRGQPGSPGKDTVVIIGQDRFDQKAALNDIADVAEGDRVRVTTKKSWLTYTVDESKKMPSDAIADSPLFTENRPGRLLLIATTYDESGNRTGKDTVVVAYLTGAKDL